MDAIAVDKIGPGYEDKEGLAEFREQTLRTQVVAVLALALGVAAYGGARLPTVSWEPLPALAGLALTAGAMHLALRYGAITSTIAMVVGLTATLTMILFLHPGTLLAGYYFVVVLAASGALGWRAGLPTAALTSGIILVVSQLSAVALPANLTIHALVFIWTTLLFAWLAARPLSATTNWAWSSYALAREKTEVARKGQAQLAQISKSLTEACDRLERLNRELQEAREAAETARRIKAEFAATVGHELRTPVNLIIGFSQMMASPRHAAYYDEPLPDSYREDVEAIQRNASHISGLVDDILDLSQIDAHRMALRKERISLARVAQEAVANVEALYLNAGLSLSVAIPADFPHVPADPVRIRQVLINLLYNAVRFTHQGGVTIGAERTADGVVVAVRDTGVGIPVDDLPRLFEEFRQSHAPMRGHLGSGLGLAVCKRFVELHGGNIWAESAPEVGTTIFFSLPVHDNVAIAPLQRLQMAPLPRKPARPGVAVLDPVGDSARVIQRYLDGYRIRTLKRLAQASRLAQDGALGALIVTSLEDQRAWHRYQQEHVELKSIPTLFCSLHTRQEIAQSIGASDYLVKPVTREQLARVVRGFGRSARNLMVIDDDAEMRSLLSRMLRSMSRRYQVTEAGDGLTGLRLVRESRPDAVLLDLLMAGADGYTVLRAIREDPLLQGLPVVVISAKGLDAGITAGMVGVSRPDGLSVGDAMASLKANLDAFLIPRPAENPNGVVVGKTPARRVSSLV